MFITSFRRVQVIIYISALTKSYGKVIFLDFLIMILQTNIWNGAFFLGLFFFFLSGLYLLNFT